MEIHFIYRIRFCFIELMLRMWSMPPEKDRPWWEAAAGICRNVFLGNGTNYLLIVFFDRSIPQQYLDWMGRREAGRVCWSWNMGRNCPLWKDPILGSCSFIAPCGQPQQQPAQAARGSFWIHAAGSSQHSYSNDQHNNLSKKLVFKIRWFWKIWFEF